MTAAYADRLKACQQCQQRRGNRCRLANQIISVLARMPNGTCPLGRWSNPTTVKSNSRPSRPGITPQTQSASHAVYPEAEHRPIRHIAAVTCHFNPCGYRLLEQNYRRFTQALPPELPLWTVELAYDHDSFRLPDGPQTIQVRGMRERHNLWQKERLLNIAIEHVPQEYDAIAWLDADLLWMNPEWLAETAERLSRYNVVQLFAGVCDTDANGNVLPSREGYVRARELGKRYGRPGGAWAARRDAIAHGLYERHIIGGGDTALVHAWEEQDTLPISLSFGSAWRAHYQKWAEVSRIARSMSYVPGDAVHLYHGTRQRRQYVERYQILHDHDYDPATDVEIDPETGLLQWSVATRERKPDLVRRLAEYFQHRREDE